MCAARRQPRHNHRPTTDENYLTFTRLLGLGLCDKFHRYPVIPFVSPPCIHGRGWTMTAREALTIAVTGAVIGFILVAAQLLFL
jgi:hypothetical protein